MLVFGVSLGQWLGMHNRSSKQGVMKIGFRGWKLVPGTVKFPCPHHAAACWGPMALRESPPTIHLQKYKVHLPQKFLISLWSWTDPVGTWTACTLSSASRNAASPCSLGVSCRVGAGPRGLEGRGGQGASLPQLRGRDGERGDEQIPPASLPGTSLCPTGGCKECGNLLVLFH